MLKRVILVFAVLSVAQSGKDLLKQFSQSSSKFAAETYKQVSKQNPNENFLVCPFSAEVILSLAQNGARGDTGREIRNTLHLPNSKEKINSIFKNVVNSVKSDDDFTINSANKIFIQSHYPIKRKFLNVSKEIYRASAENIDFSEKAQAAETINNWVAQQTQNKIQDLVDEDSLTEDTVALLVNALYFQASWKKAFKKTLTYEADFHTSAENAVRVDTMHKHDNFGYFESDELAAKFLKLPFRTDRNVHMVVVLPHEIDGLKRLEKKAEKVFSDVSFSWEPVEVALPKFKIETDIKFKEVLEKLGVKKAFGIADFSAMAGQKGEIYISDVIQKTYIKVDEEGVEAAASTAIHYHAKSLMVFPEEGKTFIADHPFLFYIEIDDVIVFTGRVTSPTI